MAYGPFIFYVFYVCSVYPRVSRGVCGGAQWLTQWLAQLLYIRYYTLHIRYIYIYVTYARVFEIPFFIVM